MGENLEYSAFAGQTNALVAARIPGIEKVDEQPWVSPELFLGTQVRVGKKPSGPGLVS